MPVDAIVNAANTTLMGGGGVDGAIHRAGGSQILAECREINKSKGGCPTGQAVVTTAGELPAKWVIHAVGPVWQGGDSGEEHLLANAYQNSLELAAENGARTIAFPNISTGIYGFPKTKAASIAYQVVSKFLQHHKLPEQVQFTCFDPENLQIYQDLVKANQL